jgi:putative peptidoglycan lipid II flippase
MPILSRFEQRDAGSIAAFIRGVLAFFFTSMTVISVIVFICVPYMVHFIAPGMHNPQLQSQLILMTRILLLQPILLGASNTIAALTQLKHRFVLYSISPLLYNVGIIIGVKYLYPSIGVTGLAWGVVLGALMHLIIQLPFFVFEWPAARLNKREVLHGIGQVLMLSIPRTLSLASTQIALFVLIGLASILTTGSIAVFSFALNLQAVPLTIIGVSYSVAAFPTLSRLFAQNNLDAFARSVEAAIRHIIFWAVPATVFTIVLRAQIVRIVLGAGQFDWAATRLTAAALALLITSLSAQALILLIARAYYAMGNTRKPLYFGCADIIVSLGSAYALTTLFNISSSFRYFVESLLRVSDVPGTSVLMLALGYALGSIAEAVWAYTYATRDMNIARRPIAYLLFQSLGSSIIGGFVAYRVLDLVGTYSVSSATFSIIMQGVLAGSIGCAMTVCVLWILHNRELAEAVESLKRKFADVRRDTTVLQPTDV